MERIGEAAMVRHRIICGDSATFQGDERDIIFLSMIADKKRKQAQTATQYEQRFNVALSRARDRLILSGPLPKTSSIRTISKPDFGAFQIADAREAHDSDTPSRSVPIQL